MAIALVESQFGPTSTQNPRNLMFLTIFGYFGPSRVRPWQGGCPWGIASAYGGAISHALGM